MHNAVKGAGIGVICLGVYIGITSLGAAGPQITRADSSSSNAEIEEVAVSQDAPVPTMSLEQAIFDALSQDAERSPEDEEKWRASVKLLRTSITSQGYRCVVPYEAAKIDSERYGIGCVNRRDRKAQTNYLLNVRTGDVEPL